MRRLLAIVALLPLLMAAGPNPWEHNVDPDERAFPRAQLFTACFSTPNSVIDTSPKRRAASYWCDMLNVGDGIAHPGTGLYDADLFYYRDILLQNHGTPGLIQGEFNYHLSYTGRCNINTCPDSAPLHAGEPCSTSSYCGGATCGKYWNYPCDEYGYGHGDQTGSPIVYKDQCPGDPTPTNESQNLCNQQVGGPAGYHWLNWMTRRRDILARDENNWRVSGYASAKNYCTSASGCSCNVQSCSGLCSSNAYVCSKSGMPCSAIAGAPTSQCPQTDEACLNVAGLGCTTNGDCGNGTCNAGSVTQKFCSSYQQRCRVDADCLYDADGIPPLESAGTCSVSRTVTGGGGGGNCSSCSWVLHDGKAGEEFWGYAGADMLTPDWSEDYLTRTVGQYGPPSDPKRFREEFGGRKAMHDIHTDNTGLNFDRNGAQAFRQSLTRLCAAGSPSNPGGSCYSNEDCGGSSGRCVGQSFADGLILDELGADRAQTGLDYARSMLRYFDAMADATHQAGRPGTYSASVGNWRRPDEQQNAHDAAYGSKWCDNSATVCTIDGDCSAGGHCVNFSPMDGFMMESGGFTDGVGANLAKRCSLSTTVGCTTPGVQSNCPSGQTCVWDYVEALDFWTDIANAPGEKWTEILPPNAVGDFNGGLAAWDKFIAWNAASHYLIYERKNFHFLMANQTESRVKQCFGCLSNGNPWPSCSGVDSGQIIPGQGKAGCFADAYAGFIQESLGYPTDEDYINDSGAGIAKRSFTHGHVAARYSGSGSYTPPTAPGGAGWSRWVRSGNQWSKQTGITSVSLSAGDAVILFTDGGEVCGNGTLEGLEECDDGEVTSGDGCGWDCRFDSATCGDGVLYGTEQCDDGNRAPCDGCSEYCLIEPPNACAPSAPYVWRNTKIDSRDTPAILPKPFTNNLGGDSNPQQTAALVFDIDNDGDLDLVATDRTQQGGASAGVVVWFETIVSGSSVSWVKHPVDNNAYTNFSIEAGGDFADVNRDGWTDMMFCAESFGGTLARTCQLYINPKNKTSTWGRSTILTAAGNQLHNQRFGDLDNDGDVDMCTQNQGSGNIYCCSPPANPSSLWTCTALGGSGGGIEGMELKDIDADGKLEVVASGGYWNITGSNGSFSLGSKTSFPNIATSTNVICRDFIPGGRMECAFGTGDGSGYVSFVKWNGSAWVTTQLQSASKAHTIEACDLDNNGTLDIIAGEQRLLNSSPGDADNKHIWAFLNDGAGAFTTTQIDYDRLTPHAVAVHEGRVGDIDADGDCDIYDKPYNGADSYSQKVPWHAVYRQDLTPKSITGWNRYQLNGNGTKNIQVQAVDVDNDGDLDILAGKSLWRRTGPGINSFVRSDIGGNCNHFMIAGDFDRDGDVDVFCKADANTSINPPGGGGNVVYAQNSGSGTFSAASTVAVSGGDFAQGVDWYYNRSGLAEIFVSWHAGTTSIDRYTISGSTMTAASRDANLIGEVEDIHLVDLDRNGHMDVVTGCYWVQNNGGSWTRRAAGGSACEAKAALGPDRNEVGDFDKDGDLDIVVGFECGGCTTTVTLYKSPGDPTGTWTSTDILSTTGPMSLGSGDADRDGDLDLMVGEHRSTGGSDLRLRYLANNGSGGFTANTVYTGDEHHDGSQMFDLDRDADLDVVSIGWSHGNVIVYEALGGGSVPPPTPTCTDGVKNGTETDTDCGGSCGGCVDGRTCVTGADCQSGVCQGTPGGGGNNHVMRWTVSSAGSNVQIIYRIADATWHFTAGETYQLSFKAKRAAGTERVGEFDAEMIRDDSPYTPLAAWHTAVDVTSAWQTFTYSADIQNSSTPGTYSRFRFSLPAYNQSGDVIYFDDLHLERTSFPPSANLFGNPDMESAGLGGWSYYSNGAALLEGNILEPGGGGTTYTCVTQAPGPTCTDNTQNGAETDVDCGGGTCVTCGDGKLCSVNSDCTSGNCSGGSCAAVPPPSVACDYYASPSGSGSGTLASPWSLATANSSLTAGKTVCLLTGNYDGQRIAPANSGASGAYITYRAADNATPTIRRTGTDPNNPAIQLSGRSYIRLIGITVDGEQYGSARAQIARWLNLGGSSTHHNVIESCTFLRAAGYDCIYFGGGSNWNTIRNSTIKWCGNLCGRDGGSGGNADCSETPTVGAWNTGESLGVWDEDSESPSASPHHNLIEGNTVQYAGHGVMIMNGYNNVIRNNYFNNRWYGTGVTGNVYNTPPGNLNPIWGEGYRPIAVGSQKGGQQGKRNLIEGNYITNDLSRNIRRPGLIQTQGSEQQIIRRNFLAYSGYHGWDASAPCCNPPACTMYHPTPTTTCWSGPYLRNNRIYNNVFYKNGAVSIQIQCDAGHLACNDNRIENNIFFENILEPFQSDFSPGYTYYQNKEVVAEANFGNPPGLLFRNNIFKRNASAAADASKIFIGTTTYTVSTLNSSSFGSGNMASNPSFIAAIPRVGFGQDFTPSDGAYQIDKAGWLTTTSSAGSGQTMPVVDVTYFTDGWGVVPGDVIQLQGQTNTARITTVNYATNTLTLDRSLTWTAGTGIGLQYTGTAMDVGPIEYGGTVQPTTYLLTVGADPSACGWVTFSSAGLDDINCGSTGSDCYGNYPSGTVVTLNRNTVSGCTFTSWTGNCAGTGSSTNVTMDAAKTCVAHWSGTPSNDRLLLVTKSPAAGGTVLSSDASGWWDASYRYRVPITVSTGSYKRIDRTVEAAVNFTTLLSGLGITGASLNLDSLRVIEVNPSTGAVIDSAVPFQFDQDADYNSSSKASGTMVFQLSGTTNASTTRRFDVYFETGGTFTAASFTAKVTTTDNVTDEGLSTVRVETQAGTYYYDKNGAGFSSLVDAAGADWLNYHPTGGDTGNYRGIPNMVLNTFGHAGYSGTTGASTAILSSGVVRSRVRSLSANGLWDVIWTFYPYYVSMNLVSRDSSKTYWLLYEGTPGGTFDTTNDRYVTSSGANNTLGTQFSSELPSPEWVYFLDQSSGRYLYLIHTQDDSSPDIYYACCSDPSSDMTVWGFGRTGSPNFCCDSYLTQTGTVLLLGLGASGTTQTEVIHSALQSLSVTVGSATQSSRGIDCGNDCQEYYANGTVVTLTETPASGYTFTSWGGDCSGTGTSASVTMTSNKTCSATWSQPANTYRLSVTVTPNGSGSVNGGGLSNCTTTCASDVAADTTVTLLANPASGYSFTGWSGTGCTGTNTSIDVTMSAARTCTASFATAAYTLQVSSNPPGGGSIGSTDGLIQCGTDCSETYASGVTATIEATAASGYSFLNWTGTNCSGGANPKGLVMNVPRACVANFSATQLSISTPTITANCESIAIEVPVSGFTNARNVNGYLEWSLAAGGSKVPGPDLYMMHSDLQPYWTGGSKLAGKLLFLRPSTTYYFRIVYGESPTWCSTSESGCNRSQEYSATTWACTLTPQSTVWGCVDGDGDAGTKCADSRCPDRATDCASDSNDRCFCTISQAISAYSGTGGARILIEDGTYREAITISGKGGGSVTTPLLLESINDAGAATGGARIDGSHASYTNPAWTLCTSAVHAACDNAPSSKGVYRMAYSGSVLDAMRWLHSVSGTTVDSYYPMQMRYASLTDCINGLENETTLQPSFCTDDSGDYVYVHINPTNGVGASPSGYSWRMTPPANTAGVTITKGGLTYAPYIELDGLAVEYWNDDAVNVTDGDHVVLQYIQTNGQGSMNFGGASQFIAAHHNYLHLTNRTKWRDSTYCHYGSDCVPSGGFTMLSGKFFHIGDNTIDGGFEDAIQNEDSHPVYTDSYGHDIARNTILGTVDDYIEMDSGNYLISLTENHMLDAIGGQSPDNAMCISTSPTDYGPWWVLYNVCDGDFDYFFKPNRGSGSAWRIVANNTFNWESEPRFGTGSGILDGAAVFLGDPWNDVGPNNWLWYNNIITVSTGVHWFADPNGRPLPAPSNALFRSDYNAYRWTGASPFIWYNSTCTATTSPSPNTLAGWRAFTGCGISNPDGHSVYLSALPNYVNASSNDFRLTSNNPSVIDQGVPLNGINTNTPHGDHDYAGAAPDIGAYETGVVPEGDDVIIISSRVRYLRRLAEELWGTE